MENPLGEQGISKIDSWSVGEEVTKEREREEREDH
jgi:hypothetical protein